jgi:hypothetical protein
MKGNTYIVRWGPGSSHPRHVQWDEEKRESGIFQSPQPFSASVMVQETDSSRESNRHRWILLHRNKDSITSIGGVVLERATTKTDSPTEPRTTEHKMTEPRKTQPWIDPIPNGLNPEWTQPRRDSTPNGLNLGLNQTWRDSTLNGLNPEGTQPRMDSTPKGLNPEWDSTLNGLNPDWDSTPNGTKPRLGLYPNRDSTSNSSQPRIAQFLV